MILWTIKLISSVRKAIAGRRYPSQLAWGVAFGVLLGLIPHGNLLAVSLVCVVLALRLNHAILALTAIGVTLVAPKLDPTFHSIGEQFFQQPDVAKAMALAWQLPLVPWTDLNNTVVMGSLLIGLVVLVPTFLLMYPLFRHWSLGLAIDEATTDETIPPQQATKPTPDHQIDGPHSGVNRPHVQPGGVPVAMTEPRDDSPQRGTEPVSLESRPIATSGRVFDVRRIDPAQTKTPRPTQIEVQPQRTPSSSQPVTPENSQTSRRTDVGDDQNKIDEALSYLLRQLRDSQDKDAA